MGRGVWRLSAGPEEISREELEVYSRQVALDDIGFEGQRKLREGRVCLLGLGGLGSPSAMKLAAMGLGFLRLVDRDVVSRSDLHRQFLYDVDSVGHPKVEVAQEKLKRINPGVEVEAIPIPFNSRNAEALIKDVDVVIDGFDRLAPRYVLNRASIRTGVPYIYGASIEMFGSVSTIVPRETPCLECLFPGVSDDQLDQCAVVGVHTSVLGITSSVEVSEALRIIMGKEPHLKARLLYVDLRNFGFDIVDLKRVPNCAACADGVIPGMPEHEGGPVEGICGRDGRGVFTVTPKGRMQLNLAELASKVRGEGLCIKTESKLGLTFSASESVMVSLLSSGVAILQVSPASGVTTEHDAWERFSKIASELRIDPKAYA